MKRIDYRGSWVLVTGASSGIGAAFARKLAHRGANLVLTARSAERLERLAADLSRINGIETRVVAADLGTPEGVRALLEGVDALGVPIEHVVNNAGFGSTGPFCTAQPETEQSMVCVNCQAVVAIARHFLPELVRRGRGGVINVASTSGYQPTPFMATYGATKAFSEAYGRMTAITTDMSVICLRLGACLPRPVDSGSAPGWLAPEDLQQLVRRCLEADVRTGTYFGVSANTRTAFDIANARAELGYEPRHDSEAYAADLPEGDGGLCRITPLET